MTEEWRTIPDFSPCYQVSNLGRVRRVAGVIFRSNGRPQSFRERVLRASPDEWGYPMVRVDGRTRKVHVLVAAAFLGPRPFAGAVVRHLDGNPSNNNVENLAYGTPSENVLDGYDYRGYLKRNQKLTERAAAEIKFRLEQGERGRSLAREYGVSEQTICDIKNRRIYRRVKI